MKPLFSLQSPISSLDASSIEDTAIIRSATSTGVRMEDGSVLPALMLAGDTPLIDAIRLVQQAAAAPLPILLIAPTHPGDAYKLIAFSQLFAALAEIAGNQSKLLETMLTTVSEAITIVDKENRVLYWNESAEKIYEISRTDVVGTSLETHFSSESIRLIDALSHGTSVQRVYHVPRPDRHVLINSAPIYRDEEIIGAISIEQDITELVRLNEELADTTAHLHTLKQEMNRFQAADDPFYMIKGHSAAVQSAIQSARKVAQTDATVLLYGESGVGKELFAQAIHQASKRHDKPFIAINCGAIPAALFESELFGYQGGAFTGAEKKGKPGKLELAHEGTLFLDEVGELPLELQVKLLRALQERQFYRVGGTEPIRVNTRIIAATNRQLEAMVAEGRFREDLYYRLHVFSIEIPSLRERREDIPELVQIFLQEYATTQNQPVPRMLPEVMQPLLHFHWPGNIRQLRNVMERLFILQENGVISAEHLPHSIRLQQSEPTPAFSFTTAEPAPMPAFTEMAGKKHDAQERERIIAALDRTYGNKKAAAELLGMSRGTLYNKMRKHGIDPEH
ncbi:sigma-54 interaction domain-containing protein [Brevibacillus fluminis]|uniref:sigma-54 interaction domain-containing protein n=1 Tax=Brevibacillus fluminis TaxID=511487 RepID=UPI001FE7706A|nr:sigma 54-interacting transcriptional regulator [Brevibacillus fluminis]